MLSNSARLCDHEQGMLQQKQSDHSEANFDTNFANT
jgi:hypothetical protein